MAPIRPLAIRSRTDISSPQRGLLPWAARSASGSGPKLRGASRARPAAPGIDRAPARSCERLARLAQRRGERVEIFAAVVGRERSAHRRGHTEAPQEGLGAEVAGAHGDALEIEDGPDVV